MRISDWSSDVCSSDLKQELTATSVDLDDYVLVNLRVGVDFGKISVSAFANNVFDKVYFVAQAPTINRYSQPRVVGVEGRISFRSEEHTSELKSLMRISYAFFCLKKTIGYIMKTQLLLHIK